MNFVYTFGEQPAISPIRHPVRNVAIIEALIVGLCILAVTPLVSLWTLDVRRLYPGYIIWGRCLVRLALAGVLYFLRPREKSLRHDSARRLQFLPSLDSERMHRSGVRQRAGGVIHVY